MRESPSKAQTTITSSEDRELLDLLELTAPSTSAPTKTDPIDTDKLLHGISVPDSILGRKKQPAIARPTWGRRRIEAPDSSSSASNRKLVIRRSTGPTAVALATGGDAQREMDVRKRRKQNEDMTEDGDDTMGGSSPSCDSPTTSPDRPTATPTPPPAKISAPSGRKLGIQRPTWLAPKAEKAKSTAPAPPSQPQPAKATSIVAPVAVAPLPPSIPMAQPPRPMVRSPVQEVANASAAFTHAVREREVPSTSTGEETSVVDAIDESASLVQAPISKPSIP